ARKDEGPLDRYRSFEIHRFPVGAGEEMVYSPLTRTAVRLPAQTVRLLQGCRQFATLDEHAAALCRALKFELLQADTIRAQLAALAQAGLLVPSRSVVAACGRTQPRPTPKIATLAVPTRNRPGSLERCLTSYVVNAVQHGRAPDVVVADDSDSLTLRLRNRRHLEDLKRRYSIRAFYAGPEERARFAAAIALEAGL